MPNLPKLSRNMATCIGLLTMLFFTSLPMLSQAQTVEWTSEVKELAEENSPPEIVYAWNNNFRTIAWSEGDQVIILDTSTYQLRTLELPSYPKLTRVIIDLGFNPAGTKIFSISLVDEPQIDSTVMEIHLLSLDGRILARNVISNLAEAKWITEDKINLTIYQDLSGEYQEIKCWDLQTGNLIDQENSQTRG